MLYLVTQAPKGKYRHMMYTSVVVVEAKTRAEALRIAHEKYPHELKDAPECSKAKAEPLEIGAHYRF